MKCSAVFVTLLALILRCNVGYVWEGKRLILPVHHRRPLTVLSSSFGSKLLFNPHQDHVQRSVPQAYSKQTESVSHAIPPAFVMSAQVHPTTAELRNHIFSKPKRWAISTKYEKPSYNEHQIPETQAQPDPEGFSEDLQDSDNWIQKTSDESGPEKNRQGGHQVMPTKLAARNVGQYVRANEESEDTYEKRSGSYETPRAEVTSQENSHEVSRTNMEPHASAYESPSTNRHTQSYQMPVAGRDLNPISYEGSPVHYPLPEYNERIPAYGSKTENTSASSKPSDLSNEAMRSQATSSMDGLNQYSFGETEDTNGGDYEEGYLEEPREDVYMESVPETKQPLEPRYTQGRPELSESYRPQFEEEELNFEPERPVRRSPSPWAVRDSYRLGEPRTEACVLPVDRGAGPDEISAWYYEPRESRCRWFGYRGHGGNANRFYSRAACEGYCIRDLENLCQAVTCSWPGTRCIMVGDDSCKQNEERHGRDWRLKCSPDHAVCLSRRNTRMAPDINFQPIPQECFQPRDGGSCERKNPANNFFYDRERNTCMTFYYHRCGGNDNRFETKSDCMTQCSP